MPGNGSRRPGPRQRGAYEDRETRSAGAREFAHAATRTPPSQHTVRPRPGTEPPCPPPRSLAEPTHEVRRAVNPRVLCRRAEPSAPAPHGRPRGRTFGTGAAQAIGRLTFRSIGLIVAPVAIETPKP